MAPLARQAAPSSAGLPHAARRWTVLALATLQQAGLTFVRFGLPALAPFMRHDLSLSLTQTGVVLGAFDLGALVTFYLTGVATGRFGERTVMALGAVATGLVVQAAAAAPTPWAVAGLLALAGAGFPSSQVAGSHAVLTAFPVRERGLAMGVRQAGLPVGGFAAALVLPWVAAVAGWQVALVAAGAGCALAGVLTFVGLGPDGAARRADSTRRPPGAPGEGPAAGHATPGPDTAGFLRTPVEFMRDRGMVAATLMACLLAASQFSLTGYLPLYLVDRFGWRREAAARMLLVVHAGGIGGRLLWGWVSDRFFGGDRVRPLALVAVAGASAAGALALLGRWAPLPGAVAAVAFWSGLTLLGWNGLYITLLSEMAGARAAPMLGLSMTVLYVATTLSPPGFGYAVEAFGAYAPAWALLVLAQLGALAATGAAGKARRGLFTLRPQA